jgi:hypothetical protein
MLVADVGRVRSSHAIAVAVLGCARLAAAQPATTPTKDTTAFDPIGADGWPLGLSLEDLRGLPACGPAGLPHTPGAVATCRPAVVPGPVQWSLGVDWTSGGTFGDVATTGGAHGLGVDLDFALSRGISIGARYELLGVGLPTAPGDDEASGISNQLFAVVKRRLWTDEVSRNAWTLGVGGGYALRGDRLGGSAPVVRASLTREVGTYIDDSSALDMQFELAYERSLGDASLEAVLASLRLGFETQIKEPTNVGEPATPSFRHTTSFFVIAGPWLGLGLGLGLPITEHLSLESDADFLFGYTRADDQEHGLDGASWTVEAGPRVTTPWPSFAPLYLQVQGGASWFSRDPVGELRPVVTGELGLRALVCGGGIDLGAWVRADAGDGLDVIAGGAVLRFALGSEGERGHGSCVRSTPTLAVPYVPPPEPVATTPTDTITISTGDVHVPDVHVPDASVTVTAPAPGPVTIEVELGAAIYGVQVHVDPRVLPLDRLRGAGWIEVELSGPDQALAQFQAELGATLGRNSIRVDGWARAATDSSVVRARFTIWPPGTRPPSR